MDDVLPPSFVKRIDGPAGSLAAELRHKCELHLTAKHRSVVWWYGRHIACLDSAHRLPRLRTGQSTLPCPAARSCIWPAAVRSPRALFRLGRTPRSLLPCSLLLLAKSASICPWLRAARSGWRAAGAAARASSLMRPRTRSAACCRWGVRCCQGLLAVRAQNQNQPFSGACLARPLVLIEPWHCASCCQVQQGDGN